MRTRDSIHRKNSPFYGPERFTYQPEHNRYICPAGQVLNSLRKSALEWRSSQRSIRLAPPRSQNYKEQGLSTEPLEDVCGVNPPEMRDELRVLDR
jgi:hypothetical protein